MVTYEYFCEQNSETIQVQHSMRERLATWGELCAKAGRDPGATPANTPVERVITGGLLGLVNGGTPSGTSVAAAKEAASLPMAGGCCGNPASCRHGS
jgi:hypothetical protein